MPEVCRAALWQVELPLKEPFVISGGQLSRRRSLIVQLWDRNGHTGMGEAAPFEFPFYSGETCDTARLVIERVLLPLLIGRTFEFSHSVRELFAGVRGNPMARAGVETAWWDLYSVAKERSLVNLLADRVGELGATGAWRGMREVIECGVALGIPPDEDQGKLVAWVEEAVARGYRRIKLKVRPGWDLEPVRVTRRTLDRLGADLPIWVDANGAYEASRHRKELESLALENVAVVEQPLAPECVWETAALARETGLPVCVDESLPSDLAARQLALLGGPMIWNLKVQRVGGLEEACRIYARGATVGATMWVGTMPETGLGAQASMALASLSGCVLPSDLEPSNRWYGEGVDLVELQMSSNGTMPIPKDRATVDLSTRGELVAELP